MNPLKTFLICLAPALLALMLVLLGNWVGEWVIWFAVVLIVVGRSQYIGNTFGSEHR